MNGDEEDSPEYRLEISALRKRWFDRARAMTTDDLPAFVGELAAHPHDYNTIVYAVAAAAVGAAWAIERSPHGGITGFQGGAVMWEVIRHWQQWPEDHLGARLLDFEQLLYPQYEASWKTIPKSLWTRLRDRAALEISTASDHGVVEDVLAHWKSIAAGVVPFGLTVESR